MNFETTVIVSAVSLWFAQAWYMNIKLERVHAKPDQLLENFDSLRDYLYEIDPQLDDERRLLLEFDKSLSSNKSSLSGIHHMELTRDKEAAGKRNLHTPFHTP